MATYYEYTWRDQPTFPKDWVVIAEIDESEPYEIDQTTIYATPTGYAVAVASGCSCWDGDWEVDEFPDLDTLIKSLQYDDRAYNPSMKGIDDLKEQISFWLGG